VLGGEAVVDRHDRDLQLAGDLGAEGVVGVEVADHPAPAVKEHQNRRWLARFICREQTACQAVAL